MLTRESAPTDWSRDGRWIAVDEYKGPTQGDATTFIVSTLDARPQRLTDTQARHGGTRFSPDGKWVAYTSEETGRFEVFVRPFDSGTAGPEQIRISEAGGDFPVWRSDGRELFFMSEDGTINSVATETLGVDLFVARPQALLRTCPGSAPQSEPLRGQFWGAPFDTLDGKRFIVTCALRPSREFTVLMNWPLAQNR